MTKRMVMAALALVGVFVATYLALFKLGIIGELTCSIQGCETVNSSRWATFLGLPVALWGVGFYLALFAVAMVGSSRMYENTGAISRALFVMSGVGVAFSAWLTYLELFVIHAVCMWCVASAVIVTAIFLLSLSELGERMGSGEEEATRA